MTVLSENRVAGPFTGNGVATAFPFSFKVFEAADLLVVSKLDLTGIESTLVLTTDYSVTLNTDQDNNPGGTVTLNTPLESGHTLALTSDLDLTQEVVVTNQGGFYPAVFNAVFDRLTIFAQQIQTRVARSFQLPITSAGVAPTISVSAGALLRWDDAGLNIVTVAPGQVLSDDYSATSITPNTIAGSGDKTFTVEAGKRYAPGLAITAANTAAPTNSMSGVVKTYDRVTGALVMTVVSSSGAGSFSAWTITPALVGGVPAARTLTAGGLVTGGGNLSADRSFTVTAATAAEIAAGVEAGKAITPAQLALAMAPQALTPGASVAWDMSLKDTAQLTLGAAANAIAKPTGYVKGKTYLLFLDQDATGGRTISAWNSCYIHLNNGGAAPTLSTGASKHDVCSITCIDDSPTTPLFLVSFGKGS